MSAGDSAKCTKIRYIVRLRQLLRRWRQKSAAARRQAHHSPNSTTTTTPTPSDVPPGHVAVLVGPTCRRFVLRAAHLNHPIFRSLLDRAEEEFGFSNHGPLAIPCDESLFEEALRFVSRPESTRATRSHIFDEFRRPYCRSFSASWDSRPLLNGSGENPVW
ncbi:hypothetical protein Sjap_017043 [Stephania japonica]|uniref:Small auxin up regulated protein n=1 Tax=Stephania japonica TaxID=461633 RepID=A0AAP0NIY8_9MAGN